MMFRISFFVDDKNLGEAFKRLAGIARNLEHQYVPNLEAKPNGKTHVAAGDSQELFVKEMHKRKLVQVNADKAREICTSMGFSPTSYSYMLQGLVKNGFLKKSGSPQKYVYTLKPEKAEK
jgi:hypothetical protein